MQPKNILLKLSSVNLGVNYVLRNNIRKFNLKFYLFLSISLIIYLKYSTFPAIEITSVLVGA